MQITEIKFRFLSYNAQIKIKITRKLKKNTHCLNLIITFKNSK